MRLLLRKNKSACMSDTGQTRAEELANTITHGLGIVISLVIMVAFIMSSANQADSLRLLATCIFSMTLIMMYSSSTIYHLLRSPSIKHCFRIVDHACIFLLIAGTYTPFMLLNLKGIWGWSMLTVIWVLAIVGVLLKIIFVGRYERLSTFIYIAMGWSVVVLAVPIYNNIAINGILLLLAGGIAYTAGTWFFVKDKTYKYFHTIWHLFVIAGSCMHALAIYYYASSSPNIT